MACAQCLLLLSFLRAGESPRKVEKISLRAVGL